MSDTSLDMSSGFEGTASSGSVGDFVALMKPRVMSLVLFTGFVGLVVAPGSMHPVLALATLICIGVGAGASGALNMWYDADIDAIMQRTAKRPVPRGRVAREEALTFGTILAVGSVMSMGLLVNWLAAALLAVTIGFYLFIYTMWLKRRTPQNIVIGGAAGSFPPMIGWAAATGTVSIESFVLFLIIFMWTPPHFWALALYREGDYSRAGVPMLPVVAGGDATRRQILVYSLILAPLGVLPAVFGLGGMIYAISASVLGGLFLLLAWRVYSCREGQAAEQAARQLFKFSILYLLLLFAILLVEYASGTKVQVWASV
ncbi:MAG: heme o synthase [Pseudomonadota bacterium]